jgi:hypothetical protein
VTEIGGAANNGISFWLGITALVLAVPMGITSNLLTPRLVSYLEKRKLIKARKTREQALQIYNRIKAFREGKRDRYMSPEFPI